MTVLPDLERELVRAAGRAGEPVVAGLQNESARARSARRRVGRPQFVVLAAVVMVVAAALAIVPGLGGGSGESAAAQVLARFAAQAETGLNTPVLKTGQALYTHEVQQTARAWYPPARGEKFGLRLGVGAPPNAPVVVVTRDAISEWTLRSGESHSQNRPLGPVRVYGSAADRAQLAAEGYPGVQRAPGGDATVGFSCCILIAGRPLSYRQVQALPRTAAGLLALVAHEPSLASARRRVTAAERIARALADINGILAAPVPSAVRAAAFEALAQLPGVKDIGTVRDPLGRTGVGLAYDQSSGVGIFNLGHGRSERFPASRQRTEVIFDQRTGTLLAYESLTLDPPALAGLSRPLVLFSTSYVSSQVVSASGVPVLPPGVARMVAVGNARMATDAARASARAAARSRRR
jgi:hypothetical protein